MGERCRPRSAIVEWRCRPQAQHGPLLNIFTNINFHSEGSGKLARGESSHNEICNHREVTLFGRFQSSAHLYRPSFTRFSDVRSRHFSKTTFYRLLASRKSHPTRA